MSCFGQDEYRKVQERITAEREQALRAVIEVKPRPSHCPPSERYARRIAKEQRMVRRALISAMVLCGLAACVLAGSAWFTYSTACVV